MWDNGGAEIKMIMLVLANHMSLVCNDIADTDIFVHSIHYHSLGTSFTYATYSRTVRARFYNAKVVQLLPNVTLYDWCWWNNVVCSSAIVLANYGLVFFMWWKNNDNWNSRLSICDVKKATVKILRAPRLWPPYDHLVTISMLRPIIDKGTYNIEGVNNMATLIVSS